MPAALAMGYYDGSKLPMWKWAQEYTLADHFFMGAFGDSYINHFWLICACTPRDPNPPANLVAQLDDRGWLKRRPDSPPSALTGPAAFVPGEFTRGRLFAVDQPAAVPAVARAAGARRRRALRRSVEGQRAAAADAEDDRRHAVGEGHFVGVVRRRVERRAEGRDAAGRREADDHLQQRAAARRISSRTTSRSTISRASRRAPPIASGTSRTTRISSPASSAAICPQWRSTSRRARSTSIPATPT